MVMAYEDLGTVVNQVLDESGFPIPFLQKHLAVPMGLSNTSVPEYVRNYKIGNIYGSSSGDPQDKKGRLEKTAVFLYALDFSEDSEIIAGIRERDSGFEYPPPEEKRVSYDGLKKAFESINNNKRYKQLALKYPELGTEVTKRFEKSGVSRSFWAKKLAPFFGRSNFIVRDFITRYKQGYPYATGAPKDPDVKLERLEELAIFLYSLDFSEDDEVIAGMRERDERFPYPPPEEKRISYEQIIEDFKAFREEFEIVKWR